ncbi:MAG: PaaI family thioesterase [Alphaproteobacteria bacterium]|nr:PaaI family thioesterase [Alphaproteobacteria bacterium]
MDEEAARAAFAAALQSHRPEFGRFFLARLFGLEVAYEDDSCIVTAPVQDYMFNPQGSLHGGVIALILDIAMGHLLHHTVGAGITLEMKTQFAKPARSGRVRAVGRFLRRGRSISYLEARMTDEAGDLVAFATSTWRKL